MSNALPAPLWCVQRLHLLPLNFAYMPCLAVWTWSVSVECFVDPEDTTLTRLVTKVTCSCSSCILAAYCHCLQGNGVLQLVITIFFFFRHYSFTVLKSVTSFHLTRSWMRFVQWFIFIILKSFFISFCHSVLGLPVSLLDIGFHLYSFCDRPIVCHSIYMTEPDQSLGFNVINYVLVN